MKDYASMSDEQIAVMVAGLCTIEGVSINEDGMAVRNVIDDSPGSYSGGDYIEFEFDPCNNPADAWPIISENKISTMWMTSEKEWCAWAEGDLEEGAWCWENVPDFYHCGESQLRAAMIVFLMMKEGE